MEHYVITVARGFGSGGKEIALKLAEKLGIECYENRILYLASELGGIEEKELLEVNEKLRERSFSKMLRELPRQLLPLPVTRNFHSEDRLFDYQSEIIRQLSDNESCVIVGKCADSILKERKNVFSVYVEASRDYCVRRVMDRMHCGEAQAHALIAKTDKYRAEYYEYYTRGNRWNRPENYDIILNSERLGDDNCIGLIMEGVRLKLKRDL